jgi:hypothetical protein
VRCRGITALLVRMCRARAASIHLSSACGSAARNRRARVMPAAELPRGARESRGARCVGGSARRARTRCPDGLPPRNRWMKCNKARRPSARGGSLRSRSWRVKGWIEGEPFHGLTVDEGLDPGACDRSALSEAVAIFRRGNTVGGSGSRRGPGPRPGGASNEFGDEVARWSDQYRRPSGRPVEERAPHSREPPTPPTG